MDNAMKYTPAGGEIRVALTRQGRHSVLTVVNTTTFPIEEASLTHVFERFYRADRSRNSQTGGYGIGLSVAKAIVTAHNGRITATADNAYSFRITVMFPA